LVVNGQGDVEDVHWALVIPRNSVSGVLALGRGKSGRKIKVLVVNRMERGKPKAITLVEIKLSLQESKARALERRGKRSR